MKIVHSCHGKFHHQDLARQLHRLGVLHTFFTGYPRFKLKNLNVPWNKVNTFPWLEVPYYAGMRYGLLNARLRREMEWQVHEVFDRHVARQMPEADAYIGLSCASLRAGRVIKQRGGKYLCDRGSSHIRYQDRLLAEEHDRHGIPYISIDRRVIEKEMAEYEMADAILVPSEFARRSFIAEGVPESKLRKVSYGVDLRRFSPVGAPEAGRFDVLFVGAASLRKGVPDLLNAYRMLRHPRKRLRFIGAVTEEVRAFLQRACGSDPSIEILGPRPQDLLREIMSTAHVMVLPSIEEGLALVQAQALACGCPVIASTNTGSEDLFTDGIEGFVVPIRSPEVIAERLQWIADDRDLQSDLHEAALRRAQAIGGWDRYGESILSAVRNLADERAQNIECQHVACDARGPVNE
ncbi:MAG: glycosyltransferase [Alphaproteobacteria bacterium]|nr:glycosyltransferase [Alphaproteobacteria bacterium]